ncbi:hypothetical protein KY346_00895 [Candidatus Woesearchaeota archaeon]|nr:hypothetical protein [Candidatus Woesearchaeota archaeon]
MNHKLITALLLIKSFILLIIVLGSTSITGGSVIGDVAGSANRPADKVHEFFGIGGVVFPIGDCGDIAHGLYESTISTPANEMVGFNTEGPSRAATVNFVLDRIRHFGTIDMIKGASLIDNPRADSMISINTEAVVRTPKETRKTFYNMDLYGITNQFFYIQHGRFATPSLDCKFVNQDGQAICDCKVHSIRDIAVAGIPNPLRVELENPSPALKQLI